jgi:pyrimidine deaminase RibD-like protein
VIDDADRLLLQRALELAERGARTAAPNPLVGCVIARNGTVVAEGWHVAPGRPHAEAMALEVAQEGARDATVYVTLEPCAHHGRTPPCSDSRMIRHRTPPARGCCSWPTPASPWISSTMMIRWRSRRGARTPASARR